MSASLVANLPSVQFAFQVTVPDIAEPLTDALYCVMRPVLGSYWKASASAEPKVTPVASLKPLYDVAVTGFVPLLAGAVRVECVAISRPVFQIQ